jgi:hypothetical protein
MEDFIDGLEDFGFARGESLILYRVKMEGGVSCGNFVR